MPAPGGNWGEFIAWDPVAGKKVWSIKEKFMTMSGALATAGDLVFYGTVDGWFRAVDARSGKVLWSQQARLRRDRPADDLSRPRRAPVRRGLFGRRRRGDGELDDAGLPAARQHALRVLARRRIAARRQRHARRPRRGAPRGTSRTTAWEASRDAPERPMALPRRSLLSRRCCALAACDRFQRRQHRRRRRCSAAGDGGRSPRVPLGDVAGAATASSAPRSAIPTATTTAGGAAGQELVRSDELRRLPRLRRDGRHGPEPDRHVLALRRHAGEHLQVDLRRPAARHAGVEPGAAAAKRSGSSSPTSSRSAAPIRARPYQASAAGRPGRRQRRARGSNARPCRPIRGRRGPAAAEPRRASTRRTPRRHGRSRQDAARRRHGANAMNRAANCRRQPRGRSSAARSRASAWRVADVVPAHVRSGRRSRDALGWGLGVVSIAVMIVIVACCSWLAICRRRPRRASARRARRCTRDERRPVLDLCRRRRSRRWSCWRARSGRCSRSPRSRCRRAPPS